MSIREERFKLQQKIASLQEKLNALRESCPHQIVDGEYKANTGNWCPQDDCYWISATCRDCGKHIHADGGTALYHMLSMSGMIETEYESVETKTNRELRKLEIERSRQVASK